MIAVLVLALIAGGLPANSAANGIEALPGPDSFGARPLPPARAFFEPQPAQGPLRSEQGSWRALGPFGGDVAALASSPTLPGLVLAGTAPTSGAGSLYRSTDGGLSWTNLAVNVGSGVHDITFADDGSVFVGTSVGLFYGVSNATQFVARDLGIGLNQVVRDVHLEQGSGSKLWVAIANGFGQQPVSLMRSDDAGVTWSNRTPPLGSGLGGAAVAVDPARTERVVAAFTRDFGGGGVFASTDGGLTWVDRSFGLPIDRPINTIVHDGTRFLVGGGQLFANQVVGLYATSNLGVDWVPLHNAAWPTLAVTEVAIDPNRPATILAACSSGGVHRSTDGGATWEIGIGGTPSLAVAAVHFQAGSSTNVLIGVDALGVYRSTNGGTGFEQSSSGLLGINTTSVAANPLNPAEIAISFAGLNSGGVLRSTDGGRTWRTQQVPPTRYSDVAFAPDGSLFALSSGPSSVAPEGLYRRQPDGGWISLGPDQGPLFESELRAIAFDAQQPGAIFVGGSDFGNVVGNESTIWRFSTSAATWTKVFEGFNFDVVTDLQFVGGNTALAAYDARSGTRPGGVLKSMNDGSDWAPAIAGLADDVRIPSLCRTSAGTWWLGALGPFGTSYVYRSVDQAASWQQLSAPTGDVFDIACDPSDQTSIYFGMSGPPWVVRTRNDGLAFEAWGQGILPPGTSREMLPLDGRLLIATASGVYRSPLLDLLFADAFEAQVGNLDTRDSR